MQAQRKRENARRDKDAAALYGAAWRKARAQFLRANPLCQCNECRQARLLTRATVVDHIRPHRGDVNLFWDRTNWQAMSKRCHDRKTARDDGGFGRARSEPDSDRTR
nr:HNH endonuclease signature motif containing protein [Paraburkholderia lacunae]